MPIERCSARQFAATAYDDVRALLDDERFLHWWEPRPDATGLRATMQRWFAHMDPRNRSSVRDALRARLNAADATTRAHVRDAAARHALALPEGVELDARVSYVQPLGADVVALLLGIDDAERAEFDALLDVIAGRIPLLIAGIETDAEPERAWAALAERTLSRVPLPGLIADLARERERGVLGEGDLPGFTMMFAYAAYENIGNFICSALVTIAANPAVWDAYAADARVRARLGEELLRVHTPLRYVQLVATGECEIEGEHVAQGDVVVAHLAQANLDERRFACPRELRLERETGHLSFGAGRLACIGASLARVQAEIALERLCADFCAPRIAGAIEPKPSPFFTAPIAVPLVMTRREAVA